MQRILWWLRRDLRLSDNSTLHHALRDATEVIPVFVLDPVLLGSSRLAPCRRRFLFDCLADLDAGLRARGSRLILRAGDPARELVGLARETRAETVYFHADITPYARKRDSRVAAELAASGIRVRTFHDVWLAGPEQVCKSDGKPYTVYTPYRRAFDRLVALPRSLGAPAAVHTPKSTASLDLSALLPARDARCAQGGEQEARRLLRSFLRRRDGLAKYGDNRNLLALDATSHLSPHLHFGTISARELVRAARAMEPGPASSHVPLWVGQLIWRDFFAQVLWHFPHAASGSFKRDLADLAWENNEKRFVAWCAGLTGYPVVDAAMRQLNETGWMHNRARMIVASFLTKDLLIDWRWGERYFMQHLIDADVAANNGGWQWAAGTGTDAQPYFRIFNPVEQGRKFDPDGAYVRRWVPELQRVPDALIHAPWLGPAGRAAAPDYPPPLVDHALQRQRALALYRRR